MSLNDLAEAQSGLAEFKILNNIEVQHCNNVLLR